MPQQPCTATTAAIFSKVIRYLQKQQQQRVLALSVMQFDSAYKAAVP
jgi:hypothetical protein